MERTYDTRFVQTTVEQVVSDYDNGKISIPPEQRRFQYSEADKVNVISQIISGLSIDNITCVSDGNKNYLCDGMHRIKTLSDFLNNKFKFQYSIAKTNKSFAKMLEVDKQLDNKYFSELSQDIQIRIKAAPLSTTLVSIVDNHNLSVQEKEDMIHHLINSMMTVKNTCAEKVSGKRITLNKTFRGSMEFTHLWSKFLDQVKTDLDIVVKNKALNSPDIAESFNFIIQYTDKNYALLDNIISRIANLEYNSCKQASGLSADLQGALFWSTLVECNQAHVDWTSFHKVFRYVRPMSFQSSVARPLGEHRLDTRKRFNVMAIFYSESMPKVIKHTNALVVALQTFLMDNNIPEECKDRITAYLSAE